MPPPSRVGIAGGDLHGANGREQVVIRHVLERHADATPSRIGVSFESKSCWTWADCVAEMRKSATRLRKAGVQRGDNVLIFLPNGEGWLRAWWGVTGLGAVMVPVHTAFMGDVLRHQCERANATVAVVDSTLRSRLEALTLPIVLLSPEDLAGETGDDANLDRPIEPWDRAAINYTSGTTGQPKGVLTAHLQTYMAGFECFNRRVDLQPDDRWLVDLPMYHVAAQQISLAALSRGASIAMNSLFSGTQYWAAAKNAGATHALLAGSMGNFLLAQPASELDRGHTLRAIVAAPVIADFRTFMRRFGIEQMVTAFGQTESGCATLASTDDGLSEGTCGKARSGIEVRLVDSNDIPVPVGEVGEMVLRTDCAWELTSGYYQDTDASSRLWRNGWMHTGDSFRCDGAGNYFFVDRLRDSLRRRGENISSFMIESIINNHESVTESACVSVPSEYGEDEIMVFIVLRDSAEVDFVDLSERLAAQMPYFMVPRFFEVIADLPKTPTMRTQKFLLKARQPSEATWDREKAGIFVTRSGIKKRSPIAATGQR